MSACSSAVLIRTASHSAGNRRGQLGWLGVVLDVLGPSDGSSVSPIGPAAADGGLADAASSVANGQAIEKSARLVSADDESDESAVQGRPKPMLHRQAVVENCGVQVGPPRLEVRCSLGAAPSV